MVAAAAAANLGSVISSIRVPADDDPGLETVYYDGSNIYVILYYFRAHPAYFTLRKYTPNGSIVSEKNIANIGYDDAERSHLGSGYFACVSGESVMQINKNTGAVVVSFAAYGVGQERADNLAWDGHYYYVSSHSSRGEFTRFTSGGVAVANWYPAGWPAAMAGTSFTSFGHRALGRSGNYLFAASAQGGPAAILTIPGGSLVRTWTFADYPLSAAYGDSSRPATIGAALWTAVNANQGRWIKEIDVEGRNGDAVTSASIGRIKAVYR